MLHLQQVLRNLFRVYNSDFHSFMMRAWLLVMILVLAVGVAVGNLSSGGGSKAHKVGSPNKGKMNCIILIYVSIISK